MTRKIRIFLGLIVFVISLALLIWGLRPTLVETRIQPVDPGQMQLPTPVSYYMESMG